MDKLKGIQRAVNVVEENMGTDMGFISGPSGSSGADGFLLSRPSGMNFEELCKTNSVMVIKSTSIPSTHHRVVGFEDKGTIIEANCQSCELVPEKRIGSNKNKTLAMKDITKKSHKIRKRVEHRRSNKLVLAEWVKSLSNELENSCKDGDLARYDGRLQEDNQLGFLAKSLFQWMVAWSVKLGLAMKC